MLHQLTPTLLVAAVLACPALGQNCWLKNQFRMVTQVNSSTSGSGPVCLTSGMQPVGTLTTSAAATSSNPQGCYSNAWQTNVSEYGLLRLQGAGQASTCSTGGVFLYLDACAGSGSSAEFWDRITITAPGVPMYTLIPLRCSLQCSGTVQMAGPQPMSQSYSMDILINGQTVLARADANGADAVVVMVPAGQSCSVHGRLRASIYHGGMLNFAQNTASYALDLTTVFDLTPLTPGATATTCSGANYNGLSARTIPVGTGCGVAPPVLAAQAPALGATAAFTVVGAPANAPTFLGLALGAAVALPFGPCTLWLDPQTAVLNLAGAASPAGQLSTALPIPTAIGLLGFTMTAQAVPLQTNGPFLGVAELSNGVELRVGY